MTNNTNKETNKKKKEGGWEVNNQRFCVVSICNILQICNGQASYSGANGNAPSHFMLQKTHIIKYWP